MPQLLSDVLERDILVVDESHLPAIGAAAMCSEVLDGQTVAPPPARRVQPRPQWRDIIAQRWEEYRQVWSSVTNTPPPSTLDEATATSTQAGPKPLAAPQPKTVTRSVRT